MIGRRTKRTPHPDARLSGSGSPRRGFVVPIAGAGLVLLAAAGLVLLAAGGCGSGEGPKETGEAMEQTEAPNPFADLRPRAGDVLVPPQIGFRWRWSGPGADGEDEATDTIQGEFSSDVLAPDEIVADSDSDDRIDPANETDPHAEAGRDTGDADEDDAGDADHAADGDASSGSDEGLPDAGALESGSPDTEPTNGEVPSELERVEVYGNGEAPIVSVELPEDRLFRVVMVDSIGAIYARVLTSASSIRVPLPPHTGPGPYQWHVELLSSADSSVIAQSGTETFEIR